MFALPVGGLSPTRMQQLLVEGTVIIHTTGSYQRIICDTWTAVLYACPLIGDRDITPGEHF